MARSGPVYNHLLSLAMGFLRPAAADPTPTTGHRAAIPGKARFVHADLSNADLLRKTLADPPVDAVMHFAAFIEAGESMQDPGKYFHNNLSLSLGLLEAAVQAGVRRFVLSSTAAVYASSETPLSEDSPLGPANVYGHSKLMMEQALEWYRHIHGRVSPHCATSTLPVRSLIAARTTGRRAT
jgi:UDP-glucose 4-epimerase